jgi:hypothetical protein
MTRSAKYVLPSMFRILAILCGVSEGIAIHEKYGDPHVTWMCGAAIFFAWVWLSEIIERYYSRKKS